MTTQRSTEVTNHSDAIPHPMISSADLAAAAQQAGTQVKRMAGRTDQFVKDYPWVAAGAMLGLGVIAGALAQRLFGHRPTVTEVLGIDHLPTKARRAVSRYF